MKHFIVLELILLLVYACGKKEEKSEKAPLRYEMKIFRLESKSGCKSDSVKCASYEINYPEFQGLSQAATDSLALKIAKAVDTGNPEVDSVSFKAAGRAFISDFENSLKDSLASSMGWYYKASVEVNVLGDSLLSLSADNEFFTGGAHGGYGIYFINMDPATGKTVALKDLLKPGFEEVLRKEGDAEFRKGLALDAMASFADLGFEFPENKFQLNDNYGFTKEGIRFVFNIYEIGPYALGAQEVLIPYEKIKDWLK